MSPESPRETEIENTQEEYSDELPRHDQIVIENITNGMENPIKKILSQLKPHIDSGEYKVIIGEDASGRIPAFAMHKILSAIYQANGFSPPQTRFVAGSRDNTWLKDIFQKKKSNLREYIEELRSFLGVDDTEGRMLIVTEYIQTGRSLQLLVDLLNEAGIKYDIATFGIERGGVHEELEEKWGAQIVSGSNQNPLLNGLHRYGGVVKDNPNIHARKLRDGDKEYHGYGGEIENEIFDEYTQARINTSRKRASQLAEKIVSEYFQENQLHQAN